MDDAITLQGFLDEEIVPGDRHGTTARFRLTVSPTDELVDELTLPCTVADPLLAHAVLHDLQPGDQIRVTGYLRLPRTPDDVMWLHVTTLEVLTTSLLAAVTDNPATSSADPSAHPSSTLPDDGLLERHGPYIAYLDPDTSITSMWTETGEWVGTAVYPDTSTNLINTHQRRTTHGET